jgi:hypothetical protein
MKKVRVAYVMLKSPQHSAHVLLETCLPISSNWLHVFPQAVCHHPTIT